MQTRVQLYQNDTKLVACAVGEPSLTLVRNDDTFGLLLAGSAHEDSFTSRLYLDRVSYLQVCGNQFSYTDFASVAIYADEGVWLAQDTSSNRFFPNPSHRPYHVVFISHAEFLRLVYFRAESLIYSVFKIAQQHFGRLPGFSFKERSLSVPEDYATAVDAVPAEQYVETAPMG